MALLNCASCGVFKVPDSVVLFLMTNWKAASVDQENRLGPVVSWQVSCRWVPEDARGREQQRYLSWVFHTLQNSGGVGLFVWKGWLLFPPPRDVSACWAEGSLPVPWGRGGDGAPTLRALEWLSLQPFSFQVRDSLLSALKEEPEYDVQPCTAASRRWCLRWMVHTLWTGASSLSFK